jgi:UDP:flavonoid glycosyltransferase YjiC (YdhE family)
MFSPAAMLLRGNPARQLGGFISFAHEYRCYLRENGFRRRALPSLWTNEGDLNLVYTSEELQPAGAELCGYRGVVATGHGVAPKSLRVTSDSVRVDTFVPQLNVLAHASVFVSHGGMNSTHESLTHGVPIAFLPRQEEQELVAARVVERGAGLFVKQAGHSVEAIAQLIRTLATEPRLAAAARKLGDGLHRGRPAPPDLVEQLVAGEPGAQR